MFFVFSVVQLLAFERWARGVGPYVKRPEAVAGILPIGHFTSFFAWVRGGGWDVLLPAGLGPHSHVARRLAVSEARHVRLDLPGGHGVGGLRGARAQGSRPQRPRLALAGRGRAGVFATCWPGCS